MSVHAIIQARMASTRLPGKVLREVGGQPILWHVIQRVRRARLLDGLSVATTTTPADDGIAALCEELEVPCFRGSEDDVLDRYYRAARALGADLVVRITADCPLVDPEIVDRVVDAYEEGDDYVSNIDPPTFPDGLDVEVMTFAALERAWRDATRRPEREHVTLHIRENPQRFRTRNVTSPQDLSSHRWTVDEVDDLAFVRRIYARFGERSFGTADVLRVLEDVPVLGALNRHIPRNEGLARSLAAEESVR